MSDKTVTLLSLICYAAGSLCFLLGTAITAYGVLRK